jgi:hypothetical protein
MVVAANKISGLFFGHRNKSDILIRMPSAMFEWLDNNEPDWRMRLEYFPLSDTVEFQFEDPDNLAMFKLKFL